MSAGAIRSSLDRLLKSAPSEPMWRLIIRAIRERGVAVIDLGMVRNGDFAFAEWARREAERQASIKRKEAGA